MMTRICARVNRNSEQLDGTGNDGVHDARGVFQQQPTLFVDSAPDALSRRHVLAAPFRQRQEEFTPANSQCLSGNVGVNTPDGARCTLGSQVVDVVPTFRTAYQKLSGKSERPPSLAFDECNDPQRAC